ncbi:MAG: WD40 repeat domain-containing protein [Planctomycetota bacterium]
MLWLALLLFWSPVDEGWVTHAVALSPDLKTVARGRMHAERGTSRVLIEDAKTGKARIEQKGPGPIRAFAFRGDSARFVASNDHGPLKVINAADGKVVAELKGHRGWVVAVAFSGKRIASAARDETLRFWDAETGKQLWIKKKINVGRVALSPDAKLLATTDQFGKVQLWDAATAKLVRTLDVGDSRWSLVVAFSPDGKRIAAGQRRVRVFEVATGKVLATLEVAKRNVTSIALSEGGQRIATADREHGVRVWNVADQKALHTWTIKFAIGSMAFSKSGTILGGAAYSGDHRSFELPATK